MFIVNPVRLLFGMLLLTLNVALAQHDRDRFSYIHEILPDVVLDIRYATPDNFVGAKVDGYLQPVALITKEAAAALFRVQVKLKQDGLALKIFDAYRPQKAVDHFIRWSTDLSDTLTKRKYYPEIDKSRVFELGYVSTRSGHTRGSTVDLTIISLDTGEELDMGSGWDFFGEISGHSTNKITITQQANREKLKNLMEENGFKSYSKEWWHYTLIEEPFPATYFDFDVK